MKVRGLGLQLMVLFQVWGARGFAVKVCLLSLVCRGMSLESSACSELLNIPKFDADHNSYPHSTQNPICKDRYHDLRSTRSRRIGARELSHDWLPIDEHENAFW